MLIHPLKLIAFFSKEKSTLGRFIFKVSQNKGKYLKHLKFKSFFLEKVKEQTV